MGQEVLWDFNGEAAFDMLGWPLTTGGDLDADGVGDIVVSAINFGVSDRGRVYAYSGKTGQNLYTWTGVGGGDSFGHAVAFAGDIDADGHDDVLIAAPWNGSNGRYAGRVYLYSGRDGSLLKTFDGEKDYFLGYGVAGAVDLTGDGWPDLVIAAPNGGNPPTGEVYVYSGRDYSLVGLVSGEGSSDSFGFALAVCEDLDGDSCDDLAIGAWFRDVNGVDSGRVYVVSGKTLTHLYSLDGEEATAYFGGSVASIGDFDGDGAGDFVVGAQGQNTSTGKGGRVYVYSGASGSSIWTLDGAHVGGRLGMSVADAGDCNDDGIADLIVGAGGAGTYGFPEGEAYVYSGRTRRLLYRFQGQMVGDGLGAYVRGATDLDGDGISEFVIASPSFDGVHQGEGLTTVYRGNDVFLEAFPSAPLPGEVVSLATRGGVPSAPVALFVVEVNGVPASLLLAVTALDANGEFELSGTVPSGLSGQEVTLQSFSIGWRGRVADSAVAAIRFQ